MFILNFIDKDGLEKVKIWTNELEDDFLNGTLKSLSLTKENFLGVYGMKKENGNKLISFYHQYKSIISSFFSNSFNLKENEIEIFFYINPTLPVKTKEGGLIAYNPRELENFEVFYNEHFATSPEEKISIPIALNQDKNVELDRIPVRGENDEDVFVPYSNKDLLNKAYLISIKIPIFRASKWPNDEFDFNFSEDEINLINSSPNADIIKTISETPIQGPLFF